LTPYTVIKCCVLTHPPDIILIFDIVKCDGYNIGKFIFILIILYDQIEKNEMGEECGTYAGRRWAYGVLTARTEGKRPLGRPRRRWEDNIKKIVMTSDGVAWTGLIWLRTGTNGERF